MPIKFETTPLLPTSYTRPLKIKKNIGRFHVLLAIFLVAVITLASQIIYTNGRFTDPPIPTNLSNIPLVYKLRRTPNWITTSRRPYTFSVINSETESEIPLGELRVAVGWSWWWWTHYNVLDLWEVPQTISSHQDSEISMPTHSARTWVHISLLSPRINITFGEFYAAGQSSNTGENNHIDNFQRCSYLLQPRAFHFSYNLIRQCLGENEQTTVATVSLMGIFKAMTFYSPNNSSKILAYADGKNSWSWKRNWDITISAEADFPSAVVGCIVAMVDTWTQQQRRKRDMENHPRD